jgi:DNA-binding NarL/FixJ family response regulator
MIKILIVEDQTLLCDMLVHCINGQDDMEVAGVTDDAAKAPELCLQLNPNLVLMDVVTKDNPNGITFAAKIHKEKKKKKIVIMTGLPEITFVDEARKAGVHSYLYKNAGKEHLFYVIRNTMQGHGIYPGPADISPLASQFTERELAVIRLVCQGKSRSEVVKELAISESVAKKIISTILDKTYFDNIMKFAVYAVSQGLIVPEKN